jgi:aromatic ring-opening dioxygenase catalytic subunit (LigB family)
METGSLYAKTTAFLQDLPRSVGMPFRSVLMVSAHWEEPNFTVMTHPQPPLLFDYYGFPAHTYQIQYPAPGLPALAKRVTQLLESAGIPNGTDATRGMDHGNFVPMAVMFPKADMPVVQLSLKRGLDPAQHLALGRALAPLRDEGVLIVGSGFSFHNLRMYGPAAAVPSAQFDAWLQEAVVEGPVARRSEKLNAWETAPSARLAHPREEHLIPLMVSAGAAEQEAGTCCFHEVSPLCTTSAFRFG